jgi:hypothetical protein
MSHYIMHLRFMNTADLPNCDAYANDDTIRNHEGGHRFDHADELPQD